MQAEYDNQIPPETKISDYEQLQEMTFAQKFQLAKELIDPFDPDFQRAVMTDIAHTYHVRETLLDILINNMIGPRKEIETEKFLNDLIIEKGLLR